MRTSTLPLLECPFCGGGLSIALRHPAAGDDVESGILRCACGEIPVVGGIPIFRREGRVDVMQQTRDVSMSVGPTVRRLLDLVRADRGDEALRLLLVPPGDFLRRALLAVDLLPAGLQRRTRSLVEAAWERRSRRRSRLFLSNSPDVKARQVLAELCRSLNRPEHFNHFFHRFSQPRHLTSLSLAMLLTEGRGAGLDLACGFGHTLHTLTAASPSRPWIGLDRNFFELFVARRWVAPGADYLCADADGPLPLARGVIGGALCADAFHYFLRKRLCVEELLRVVSLDGPILLARVGNRLVEPREGYELDPGEYRALFAGIRTRMLGDGQLLERYLARLGPALAADRSASELAGEKWLSLVADRSGAVFEEHGALLAWPHGLGRLRVNPLYVREAGSSDGRWTLRMPSKWFEFENGACRAYMPEGVALDDRVLGDLELGFRSPAIEELVRRCVVLGLPERYV